MARFIFHEILLIFLRIFNLLEDIIKEVSISYYAWECNEEADKIRNCAYRKLNVIIMSCSLIDYFFSLFCFTKKMCEIDKECLYFGYMKMYF